jgi:hypothetical protein
LLIKTWWMMYVFGAAIWSCLGDDIPLKERFAGSRIACCNLRNARSALIQLFLSDRKSSYPRPPLLPGLPTKQCASLPASTRQDILSRRPFRRGYKPQLNLKKACFISFGASGLVNLRLSLLCVLYFEMHLPSTAMRVARTCFMVQPSVATPRISTQLLLPLRLLSFT